MYDCSDLTNPRVGLPKAKQKDLASSRRIGGTTATLACNCGDKYTIKVLDMWVGEYVHLHTRTTMEILSVLLLEMMRSTKTVTVSTLSGM